MKSLFINRMPEDTYSREVVGGLSGPGKSSGFLFKEGTLDKELLTNRDRLDHLGFLATKLRILGEYLTVMEADEMTGDNRNDYQDIGEIIYQVSGEITEMLDKMWEVRRAA